MTGAPKRGPRWSAVRRVLLTGAFLALAFGLADVAIALTLHHGFRRLLWLTDDFVWMMPLSYTMLFAVPAVILAAIAARWPVFAYRATFGFLGFLGFFSLVELIPWLHLAAVIILSMGLAAAVTRVAVAHQPGMGLVTRRLTPALGAIVLAATLWKTAGGALRERLAIDDLPAARADAPNVLMFILDTVRASRIGAYGYPRPTSPNVDRLAARAVTFDWAVATSPTSLPSHASMFTGRLPDEIDAGWLTPLGDRFPTLGEALQDRGYVTAAFSGNLFYFTRETGLDRGFIRFTDHPRSLRRIVTTSSLGQAIVRLQMIARLGRAAAQQVMQVRRISQPKTAPDVDSEFHGWFAARDEDRPFFAVLNYLDAHAPYDPPDDLRQEFVRPCVRGLQTQEQCVRQVRSDLYDATIANVDRHVGALLDSLDALGEMDNTIVVVTSDHGELLGEHGLFGHGNSLYFESLHVPLMVAIPDGPAGRVTRPVSLSGFAATVLDLVGGDPPPDLAGTSWRPLWTADRSPPDDTLMAFVRQGINKPEHEPVAHGDLYSLTTWPVHYITSTDGTEELFDIRERPGRRADRIAAPEHAATVQSLRAAIERRRASIRSDDGGS